MWHLLLYFKNPYNTMLLQYFFCWLSHRFLMKKNLFATWTHFWKSEVVCLSVFKCSIFLFFFHKTCKDRALRPWTPDDSLPSPGEVPTVTSSSDCLFFRWTQSIVTLAGRLSCLWSGATIRRSSSKGFVLYLLLNKLFLQCAYVMIMVLYTAYIPCKRKV